MEEPQKKLSRAERKANRENAIAAIESGMSIQDAAAQFGFSEPYLRNAARVARQETLSHAQRRERRELAQKMAEEGTPIHEIAEKLGLSVGYLRYYWRLHGPLPPALWRVRQGGDTTRSLGSRTYAILAELINTGAPVPEIAQKHSVTRARVYQIAQAASDAGIALSAVYVPRGAETADASPEGNSLPQPDQPS